MPADVYHRSEPGRCCMGGHDSPSMISDGCDDASVAKKKSSPCPDQAVPSFKSFASKLAVIASRKPALFDLARSISWGAVILSAAKAAVISERHKITSRCIAHTTIQSRTAVKKSRHGGSARGSRPQSLSNE